MEAIHLFLEIFTIREFSHWSEELIFFLSIILVSYVCVEFRQRELKWYIFDICIPYRCLSPVTGLCLHCLMCWLGKVCAGFQVYGKQYSVQRCTGSFSEVQTWQWVGIHFASLQKFSKPTSTCKPIIFYMVNRRRNGHTLAPLQKRQQLYHYHAPLWSARSRSCSVSHTVGLTFHTWTESPVYSCFQGVSVSPVVIVRFQIQVIHSSRHLDPPPTAPLEQPHGYLDGWEKGNGH